MLKNPINKLSFKVANKKIRTGDVLNLIAEAFDRRGRSISNAPINYSYTGKADYGTGLPASAQITADGRFVAETAGMYTVSASTNGFIKSETINSQPCSSTTVLAPSTKLW